MIQAGSCIPPIFNSSLERCVNFLARVSLGDEEKEPAAASAAAALGESLRLLKISCKLRLLLVLLFLECDLFHQCIMEIIQMQQIQPPLIFLCSLQFNGL